MERRVTDEGGRTGEAVVSGLVLDLDFDFDFEDMYGRDRARFGRGRRR